MKSEHYLFAGGKGAHIGPGCLGGQSLGEDRNGGKEKKRSDCDKEAIVGHALPYLAGSGLGKVHNDAYCPPSRCAACIWLESPATVFALICAGTLGLF
jgi:hypothetical protein